MNRRNGFTLIEILTVVIVIALIASFIVPRMLKGVGKAKHDIAKAKMSIIEGALGRFYFDCGRYPDDSEGLVALLEAPGDLEEKWDGRYIKESELLDPWDNPYIYVEEGFINIGSYDLISYGADGAEGGEEENEDIFND